MPSKALASPFLYHYTSIEGLLGIVSSRSIWATHLRYQNDSSEYQRALDIARDLIEEGESRSPQYLGDWPNAIRDMQDLNFCAFSLSQEKDLLSQWRAYGDDGFGVAIGFLKNRLDKLCQSQDLGLSLLECVYDEKKQVTSLKQLLREAWNAASVVKDTSAKFRGHSIESEKDVPHYLAMELAEVARGMKHPAFTDEREWRIVGPMLTSKELRYRVRGRALVPYHKIPLNSLENLGIGQVVVGPAPEQSLASRAVESMLEARGLDAEVIVSEIPYRNLS